MPNKISLVAYFECNEASSSDALLDSHISAYSLAKVNATQISTAAGIVNSARFYDRSNQQHFNSDDGVWRLGGAGSSFTINAWWYPTLLPAGTDLPIFSLWDPGNSDRQYLVDYRVNDANWRAFVSSDGVGATGVGSSTFTNAVGNTWHMVTLRYDASSGDLTLLVNNNAFTITPGDVFGGNGNALFEISARTSASAYQQGRIDEVGLWERALSDSEITDLYGGGTAPAFSTFSTGAANAEEAQRLTLARGQGLSGKDLRVDNNLKVTRNQTGADVYTIFYKEFPN